MHLALWFFEISRCSVLINQELRRVCLAAVQRYTVLANVYHFDNHGLYIIALTVTRTCSLVHVTIGRTAAF